MFDSEKELDDFLKGLEELSTFKKKVLIAYERCGFNVTNACSAAGVSPAAFYYWKKHDHIFKTQLLLLDEMFGDFVEGKLRELANGKYKQATRFDAELGINVPVFDGDGKPVYTEYYQTPPNASVVMFLARTKFKDRGYDENAPAKDPNADSDANKPLLIDWRHGIVPEEGDELTPDNSNPNLPAVQ